MLQNMMRASTLDKAFYNIVENDSKYSGQAAMVVVITSVAGAIGFALAPGDQPLIRTAILAAIGGVIAWLAYSFITNLVGNALGGNSDFGQSSRVLGFAQAPMVLAIVPFIGAFIGSILTLIASVVAIREAHDFSTGKALGTAIIGWLVFALVRIFLPIV